MKWEEHRNKSNRQTNQFQTPKVKAKQFIPWLSSAQDMIYQSENRITNIVHLNDMFFALC